MRIAIIVGVACFMLLSPRGWSAEPVDFTVGNYRFERPEGWQWVSPSSPMRKAELKVVGEDGAQAEVVFFHFGPGQGGSVEANIQRWIGQFQGGEAATAEEVVGSSKVYFVKVEGTFLSGMPGTEPTPKKGYGMRGAIIVCPEGDVYVKMTGPAGLVEASEAVFRQMVIDSLMRAPH